MQDRTWLIGSLELVLGTILALGLLQTPAAAQNAPDHPWVLWTGRPIFRSPKINPAPSKDSFTIGVRKFQAGRYTDAVSDLKEADSQNPGNALTQYYIASAYAQIYQKEDAVSYFQRAYAYARGDSKIRALATKALSMLGEKPSAMPLPVPSSKPSVFSPVAPAHGLLNLSPTPVNYNQEVADREAARVLRSAGFDDGYGGAHSSTDTEFLNYADYLRDPMRLLGAGPGGNPEAAQYLSTIQGAGISADWTNPTRSALVSELQQQALWQTIDYPTYKQRMQRVWHDMWNECVERVRKAAEKKLAGTQTVSGADGRHEVPYTEAERTRVMDAVNGFAAAVKGIIRTYEIVESLEYVPPEAPANFTKTR